MEVADQWRREWAGTAEYGKVTEGGITRRVARAMEVLHASGPGARVRVMRAAYHSTAGPGTPASSYMLHSSRRILSSGFNLEEPPSLPSRPLEISSLPLESSPESQTETENYKVTEPDDIEISEPSKWRGSRKPNGIRMPSEESSSTDNASIIDLDSRSNSRNLHRKYSYDSENSDIQWNKRNSRMSPLLDPPITLNTLKYKSLLNNSSEWNNRRKSYSFEDTSPIYETPFQNESQAMESSTDSGICKSSEIVNDQTIDDNINKYVEKKHKNTVGDESFQDWLSKNRTNSFYKGTKFKSYREHEVVIEDPVENNISLQATGKVCITLPITVEKGYEGPQSKNQHQNEEGNRKVKKVEFCKTELHFAAESGKVNIIATDEKPPPSNDFRKRRSMFLPIQNMVDKPITLFGDKTKEYNELNNPDEIFTNESSESDENTAATKSILKNKIPKPKPYLLGENMVFGMKDDVQRNDYQNDLSVATAVSLINKQLEADKRYNNEKIEIYPRPTHNRLVDNDTLRTNKQGPTRNGKTEFSDSNRRDSKTVDIAINHFQGSPLQNKHKTRQLRESELTYFGVDNVQSNENHKLTSERVNKIRLSNTNDDYSIFNSVRLIQQVSHSVSNSEPESEDSPEYQNIPLNTSYAPVPTPRHRLKYDDQPNEIEEIDVLKPTITREESALNDSVNRISRRTKSREQYESITSMSRSRSEPRKSYSNSMSKSRGTEGQSTRCTRYNQIEKQKAEAKEGKKISPKTSDIKLKNIPNDDNPLYVNLNSDTEIKNQKVIQRNVEKKLNDSQKKLVDVHKNELKKNNKSDTHNNSSIKKSPTKSTSSHGRDDIRTNSYRKTNSGQRNIKDGNTKADEMLSSNEKKSIKQVAQESNNVLKKDEHNSRSSRPKTCTTETNKLGTRPGDKSPKISVVKESKDKIINHNRWLSPEKKGSAKETINTRDRTSDTESPNQRLTIIHTKPAEKNLLKVSNTKTANESTPKRNQYVINYDDKNGTMSSVCKIKPGLHSSRSRNIPIEKLRGDCKENKNYLLQPDHHQEDIKKLKLADNKWKAKVHSQRSCQLL